MYSVQGLLLIRNNIILLSIIMIYHYTEYYVQGLLITRNKVIDGYTRMNRSFIR